MKWWGVTVECEKCKINYKKGLDEGFSEGRNEGSNEAYSKYAHAINISIDLSEYFFELFDSDTSISYHDKDLRSKDLRSKDLRKIIVVHSMLTGGKIISIGKRAISNSLIYCDVPINTIKMVLKEYISIFSKDRIKHTVGLNNIDESQNIKISLPFFFYCLNEMVENSMKYGYVTDDIPRELEAYLKIENNFLVLTLTNKVKLNIKPGTEKGVESICILHDLYDYPDPVIPKINDGQYSIKVCVGGLVSSERLNSKLKININ